MNSVISSMYDVFLKLTNEFSEKYKSVFISISDKVELYNSFVVKSIAITKDAKEIVFDLTNDKTGNPKTKFYTIAKLMLEHTYDDAGVAAKIQVSVSISGKPYTVEYSNGKYAYPKEVSGIADKIDFEDYFLVKFYNVFPVSYSDEFSLIKAVVGKFFNINNTPTSISQNIAKYFDLVTGISVESTPESTSVINKQIEMSNLQSEIESRRKSYDDLSAKLTSKKEDLRKIGEAKGIINSKSSELDSLKSDLATLTQGVRSRAENKEKAQSTLTVIADALQNASLGEDERKSLVDRKLKMESLISFYDTLILESGRIIDSISPRIALIESEQNKVTAAAEMDPEQVIYRDVETYTRMLDSLNTEIMTISARISELRKDITLISEKEGMLKYTTKVNYADVCDLFRRNTFLDENSLFVYNFLMTYSTVILSKTSDEDTPTTLFKLFGL